MCEHELKQALLDIEFLQECNNAVNLALSVTRRELAAANARIASLEKQNADLFPYYQDHLEGALIPATEYQQWIKRAEQTEAQCAAIVAAYQNMKGDFEHWAYCELIDSPPGKKCTCGVWELVAAIEAALEVKP